MGQTSENPSVYAALSNFCVIITRASIRRTIPVAFMYIYLLILQITLLVSVNQGDLHLIYFAFSIVMLLPTPS